METRRPDIARAGPGENLPKPVDRVEDREDHDVVDRLVESGRGVFGAGAVLGQRVARDRNGDIRHVPVDKLAPARRRRGEHSPAGRRHRGAEEADVDGIGGSHSGRGKADGPATAGSRRAQRVRSQLHRPAPHGRDTVAAGRGRAAGDAPASARDRERHLRVGNGKPGSVRHLDGWWGVHGESREPGLPVAGDLLEVETERLKEQLAPLAARHRQPRGDQEDNEPTPSEARDQATYRGITHCTKRPRASTTPIGNRRMSSTSGTAWPPPACARSAAKVSEKASAPA